jgi:hypothetical protein
MQGERLLCPWGFEERGITSSQALLRVCSSDAIPPTISSLHTAAPTRVFVYFEGTVKSAMPVTFFLTLFQIRNRGDAHAW